MSYRKVLIIRLSALGDVAMTVHKRSEKFTGCRRRCQGKAQGLCRALSSGSGGSSVVHRCRSGFA